MSATAKRRRVLFVAEAVTLAHVGRAHALAQTLDPERFEVHGAWDPRYNSLLGDLPYIFHPIRSLPTDEFLSRLSRGAAMHDADTLRDYVGQDIAVIKSVNPDVVVGDFRLSLAASARLQHVTLITIANAYWSPFANQTFDFQEYDYPMSRFLGSRLARRAFQIYRPLGFATHTRPLNKVLRECGIPPIGNDIRVMYTFGDWTAYADLPELIPVAAMPSNHRFIGPVLWAPFVPLPEWWNDLPSDRPVVYVTLGSSGESHLLPIVLETLAGFNVTAIAATAGRLLLEHVPDNARIANFLPGSEAAARSTLVICNGGSPTTYQALAGGTPVLGIVSNNMDQHLNMEFVGGAGAGEILRARGLDRDGLREAVSRMLGATSYRKAAVTLAAGFSRSDVKTRFPGLIEEVIGPAS